MKFIPINLIAISLIFGMSCTNKVQQADSESINLYIGTYTSGESKGIYHCQFDTVNGIISTPKLVASISNPSFLAFSEKKKYLYAISEEGRKANSPSGEAIAYQVINNDSLKYLNKMGTGGNHPCYISTKDNFIFVANYTSGDLSVLSLNENRTIDSLCCMVHHEGNGPNQQRQNGPHAHCIRPFPDSDLIFSADLGIDKIIIYRLNLIQRSLEKTDQISLPPGAGPRHIDFHPSGKYIAVINELDCTITHYAIDPEKTKIDLLQSISTLPADFKKENTSADIHYSKDGRFLYGSNRGHNSIVIYKVDPKSGNLELIGWESTRGITPRNFTIDPSGKFLLVANQNSHNIVVFQIDQQTGKLKTTGNDVHVSMPVCLLF